MSSNRSPRFTTAAAGRTQAREGRGAAGALLRAAGALPINQTGGRPGRTARQPVFKKELHGHENVQSQRAPQRPKGEQIELQQRPSKALPPAVGPQGQLSQHQQQKPSMAPPSTQGQQPPAQSHQQQEKASMVLQDAGGSGLAEATEPATHAASGSTTKTKQHQTPSMVLPPAHELQDQQNSLPQKQQQERSMLPQPKLGDFLEHCLGGAEAVLQNEIDAATEAEEKSKAEKMADCNDSEMPSSVDKTLFCTSEDDSSDESDDGPGLEDMFDFDPYKLAELMAKGASQAELTDHLEESYADALTRRLSTNISACIPEPATCESTALEQSGCAEVALGAEQSNVQMGNLSPLMTPEQGTPLVTPRGSRTSGKLEVCLAGSAEKLKQARDDSDRYQERARRSIAVQHRPSAMKRASAASRAVETLGRRSLALIQDAPAEEREQLEGAVQSAMRRASNRHRKSVTKAVEVLEEAADITGKSLDTCTEEEFDDQVEILQKAMEDANRRHRRSITEAVHNVVAGPSQEEPASKKADVQATEEVSDNVADAFAARRAELAARCERREQALNSLEENRASAARKAATEKEVAAKAKIQNAVNSAFTSKAWLPDFYEKERLQQERLQQEGCHGAYTFMQDEWRPEPETFVGDQSSGWCAQTDCRSHEQAGFSYDQPIYGQEQFWFEGQSVKSQSYSKETAWTQGQDMMYGQNSYSSGQDQTAYASHQAWSQQQEQSMYGQEQAVYGQYSGSVEHVQDPHMYGQYAGTADQAWYGEQDLACASKASAWGTDTSSLRGNWRYGSA